MRRHGVLILTLCLAAVAVFFASPVTAETDAPIAVSAEVDPDLELSGDGTITYIRFVLTNAAATPYVLHNATLACAQLSVAEAFSTSVEVPAHGTKEIMLQNVAVASSQLETALTFLLSWQEVSYAPEDLQNVVPLYTSRTVSVDLTIPRFIEPVMSVSVSSDVTLAKPGATVTAVYTLKNNTKFDMTSLSLYDVGALNMLIPLERTSLLAGETMQVTHTFEMGDTPALLQPKVLYNVRGKLVETTAEQPLTVDSAVISLDFSVETYPATADGVLFSISVTNNGSHPMTDITILDEIQTEVAKPFSLAPEQTKTLSYMASTAVSATQSRIVTFTVTATDCFYETYTYVDPNQYEVLPYVTSDQVNISLSATLTNTYTNENGVLCGTVAFELRNYSAVTLTNASLNETLVYTAAPLITYSELTQGITTFSQDFAVADISALSFALVAFDPAGNEYRSSNVTIDLSKLTANPDAAADDLLVSPDVIGSGIDMDKYFKLAYKTLLVVAICVGVCCVIIYGLYSAEKREKANLPLEDSGLTDKVFDLSAVDANEPDAFRTGRLEPITASDQTSQYGYVAPTKLRYIEQTQASGNAFSNIPAGETGDDAPPEVKIYRRTDDPSGKAAVVRKASTTAENNGLEQTKRIPAVLQRDALKANGERRSQPKPNTQQAIRSSDSAYPKAIPAPEQRIRREGRPLTAVYRMQSYSPIR